MIRRIRMALFHIKTREKLPRLPGQYANEFDHDRATAYAEIFARTAARDPAAVRRLMKEHNVDTVEALAKVIEWQAPRQADWQRRLFYLVLRVLGETAQEDVVRPHLQSIKRKPRP